ncbi:hypothetical protein ACGFR6_22485 [Streptomyces sp. NPDC048567]|uniref:hypothetical protein n=1 Tax=Streptomyces sp. NPDC048567 TaxID=3365570 RepID=UPI00371CA2F3
MKRARIAGCLVSAAAAVGTVLVAAPAASAYTTYTDDECSSSTRCFAIFFNSRQNIGIFSSACFITNKTEDSHLGYDHLTSSGMQQVRYEFNHGSGFHGGLPNGSYCQGTDPGSGWSVKNNAAGASNGDTRSHRVYYNSNQMGTSQTIESGANDNLVAALKNNNASSKRL